jgi:ferric-dicitrate binding protein FerR (iron transport regulator)
MRRRSENRLARSALAVLLGAVLAAGVAAQAPGAAQRAGAVADLVPRVTVTRGKKASDLKVQEAVFLGDGVETHSKARARLRLLDDSIINMGPRTQVTIEDLNLDTEETSLDLKYGRLRADVVRQPTGGRRFRVSTRTALLGAVGTTLFVAALPNETAVANLSQDPTADVWVRSSDPKLTLEIILKPGYGTRVRRGQRPNPPRLWSKEDIALANDDTREFR